MYIIPRPRAEPALTSAGPFDPVRQLLIVERAERILARDRRLRRLTGIVGALVCIVTFCIGAAYPYAVAAPCEQASGEGRKALWTMGRAQAIHYAKKGRYSDMLSEVHTPRVSENYRYTLEVADDGQSFRGYALGRRRSIVSGDVWMVDNREPMVRPLFPRICE